MWRRIGSNAIANLSAGVSVTVYQFGLTAIASRTFGSDGFTIWALAVSLAGLVPLFATNLSTIVTRRLVECSSDLATAVKYAGQNLAYRLGLFSVAAIGLAALLLQQHSAPLQEMGMGEYMLLILLLIASQLWLVLLQPYFGSQYAQEKNWQVTRVIAGTRMGGMLALGLACYLFDEIGLPVAALSLLIGTLLGLWISTLHTRKNGIRAATHSVDEETLVMQPLLKAFAVWAVGSAVIQYGLPAFMSLLAPTNFNAFYLAYVLNLIVVGTVGAAASALLAPLTRQRLAGATDALERLLFWAPLATGVLLVGLMLLVWHALPAVLNIWSANIASSDAVRNSLFWLALQTIARSMTLVHSVLLSSAGRPGQMSRPVLFEIGLTILVALPLGWQYGATAFLATLAAAGLFTALYTAWITLSLGVSRPASRGYLSLTFAGAQALCLGIWTFASQ